MGILILIFSKPISSIYNLFVFSSRRRHTILQGDWSSDVCSSDKRATEPCGHAREAVSRRSYARTQGGSMATDCITQTTFRFQQNSKPVIASFDMAHASSDGGAVLLKAIDATLSLTERLANALNDVRQPGKVRHQDR